MNALEYIKPVFLNSIRIEDALGIDEAISKHARELNEHNHGIFWGAVQDNALIVAILTICKLYDTSSKNKEKHTVPALLEWFELNLKPDNVVHLSMDTFSQAPICIFEKAPFFLENFEKNFDATKIEFFKLLKMNTPTQNNNKDLNQLILYRHQVLAHQAVLKQSAREKFRHLPSLASMETLGKWAESLCETMMKMFDCPVLKTGRCTRMAALNVIKKVLSKNFDDPAKSVLENYRAYEEFYDRLK